VISLLYVLMFASLYGLLSFFDMKLFKFSFFQAMKNILNTELPSNMTVILLVLFVGLSSSVVLDFRVYRDKKKKKNKGEPSSS
jgi:hypothetical protein